MKLKLNIRPARALVFDIENRPLSYWYDGNPTAEVTMIAWKFTGEGKEIRVAALRKNSLGSHSLLKQFLPDYDKADVVIGHNIRSHDLPILNAITVENNLDPLKPKLTIDTLRDLGRYKDIPKSLEYLTELLGCPYQKFHMTQHSWRDANRLKSSGMVKARERVATDVLATEWVYNELVERKMLVKPPKVWRS